MIVVILFGQRQIIAIGQFFKLIFRCGNVGAFLEINTKLEKNFTTFMASMVILKL